MLRYAALLFLLSITIVACSGSTSTDSVSVATHAPLRDPGTTGPYRVERTQFDLEKESTTTGEPRQLPTRVWYPAGAPGPFPVVVYSHGNGGIPDGATYLVEHLASWGYIVAAPAHTGNTFAECPDGCYDDRWTDTAANRPADVEFVADAVLKDKTLGVLASRDQAAVVGFSLGGWTAINSTSGGRFDAAIAQAPSPQYELLEVAKKSKIPVLIMGGGKDTVADPNSAQSAFESLPTGADHYLAWFPQAQHSSFFDTCFETICEKEQDRPRLHDEMNRYAVAFLQTYVIGDSRYKQYLVDTTDAQVTAKE